MSTWKVKLDMGCSGKTVTLDTVLKLVTRATGVRYLSFIDLGFW